MLDSYQNWMSKIDSSTSLGNLIIPGTHDSATYDIKMPDFGYATCQKDDISTQLSNGIRFFDLRIGYRCNTNDETLALFHGIFFCGIYLKDVFNTFAEFLSSNSKETLLVCIKEENNRCGDFSSLIGNLYDEYSEYFYIEKTMPPNLGAARGKMVLLNRAENNRGINLVAGWKDNYEEPFQLPSQDIWIQDYYSISAPSFSQKVTRKIQAITAMRIKCSNSSISLGLNFWSHAMSSLRTPQAFAKDINKQMSQTEFSKADRGVQIMDFLRQDTVRAMIDQNCANYPKQ